MGRPDLDSPRPVLSAPSPTVAPDPSQAASCWIDTEFVEWWKRKNQRPDADDLRREIQATRDRLAQVDAEIRRLAAEPEIDPVERKTPSDGT